MSIKVECADCDKSYRVGDNLAGKKFRCKACGATVAVPGEAFDDYEVIEDEDDEPEVAPRPARRPKASSKKSSKTKSTSQNPLLWIGITTR